MEKMEWAIKQVTRGEPKTLALVNKKSHAIEVARTLEVFLGLNYLELKVVNDKESQK